MKRGVRSQQARGVGGTGHRRRWGEEIGGRPSKLNQIKPNQGEIMKAAKIEDEEDDEEEKDGARWQRALLKFPFLNPFCRYPARLLNKRFMV